MSTETIYAIDDLGHGSLTHVIVNNGLRFESRYDGDPGTALLAVGWGDLETAEANYANARQAALSRIDEVKDSVATVQNRSQRIEPLVHFRGRELMLFIDASPPTWWLPRVKVERLKNGEPMIGIGWLRRAYGLWIEKDER